MVFERSADVADGCITNEGRHVDPLEALQQGSRILEPVLAPAGFVFAPVGSGKSSGGHFAAGAFTKDTRRLELHFRFSLGLVSYSVGVASLSHSDYMRALGCRREAVYPGFSADPLDGFRHLASDLERFGDEFLKGADQQFLARAEWIANNPEPKGFAAMERDL